jgi:hypothetical protein
VPASSPAACCWSRDGRRLHDALSVGSQPVTLVTPAHLDWLLTCLACLLALAGRSLPEGAGSNPQVQEEQCQDGPEADQQAARQRALQRPRQLQRPGEVGAGRAGALLPADQDQGLVRAAAAPEGDPAGQGPARVAAAARGAAVSSLGRRAAGHRCCPPLGCSGCARVVWRYASPGRGCTAGSGS